MILMLAVSSGVIFAVGSVVFVAVFTAALALGYTRFAELGDEDLPPSDSRN